MSASDEDLQANERSTSELIETLGEDVDKCWEALQGTIDAGKRVDGGLEVDYEFQARQLIRAVFAYIEGVSFAARLWAVWKLMDRDAISSEERWMAVEKRFELDDKGRVVEGVAKLNLGRNIKFTFALLDRAHGVEPQLDTSQKWWSCLQSSIKVRDRLTHPRFPEDLDVLPDELIAAMQAERGFSTLIHRYGELHGGADAELPAE